MGLARNRLLDEETLVKYLDALTIISHPEVGYEDDYKTAYEKFVRLATLAREKIIKNLTKEEQEFLSNSEDFYLFIYKRKTGLRQILVNQFSRLRNLVKKDIDNKKTAIVDGKIKSVDLLGFNWPQWPDKDAILNRFNKVIDDNLETEQYLRGKSRRVNNVGGEGARILEQFFFASKLFSPLISISAGRENDVIKLFNDAGLPYEKAVQKLGNQWFVALFPLLLARDRIILKKMGVNPDFPSILGPSIVHYTDMLLGRQFMDNSVCKFDPKTGEILLNVLGVGGHGTGIQRGVQEKDTLRDMILAGETYCNQQGDDSGDKERINGDLRAFLIKQGFSSMVVATKKQVVEYKYEASQPVVTRLLSEGKEVKLKVENEPERKILRTEERVVEGAKHLVAISDTGEEIDLTQMAMDKFKPVNDILDEAANISIDSEENRKEQKFKIVEAGEEFLKFKKWLDKIEFIPAGEKPVKVFKADWQQGGQLAAFDDARLWSFAEKSQLKGSVKLKNRKGKEVEFSSDDLYALARYFNTNNFDVDPVAFVANRIASVKKAYHNWLIFAAVNRNEDPLSVLKERQKLEEFTAGEMDNITTEQWNDRCEAVATLMNMSFPLPTETKKGATKPNLMAQDVSQFEATLSLTDINGERLDIAQLEAMRDDILKETDQARRDNIKNNLLSKMGIGFAIPSSLKGVRPLGIIQVPGTDFTQFKEPEQGPEVVRQLNEIFEDNLFDPETLSWKTTASIGIKWAQQEAERGLIQPDLAQAFEKLCTDLQSKPAINQKDPNDEGAKWSKFIYEVSKIFNREKESYSILFKWNEYCQELVSSGKELNFENMQAALYRAMDPEKMLSWAFSTEDKKLEKAITDALTEEVLPSFKEKFKGVIVQQIELIEATSEAAYRVLQKMGSGLDIKKVSSLINKTIEDLRAKLPGLSAKMIAKAKSKAALTVSKMFKVKKAKKPSKPGAVKVSKPAPTEKAVGKKEMAALEKLLKEVKAKDPVKITAADAKLLGEQLAEKYISDESAGGTIRSSILDALSKLSDTAYRDTLLYTILSSVYAQKGVTLNALKEIALNFIKPAGWKNGRIKDADKEAAAVAIMMAVSYYLSSQGQAKRSETVKEINDLFSEVLADPNFQEAYVRRVFENTYYEKGRNDKAVTEAVARVEEYIADVNITPDEEASERFQKTLIKLVFSAFFESAKIRDINAAKEAGKKTQSLEVLGPSDLFVDAVREYADLLEAPESAAVKAYLNSLQNFAERFEKLEDKTPDAVWKIINELGLTDKAVRADIANFYLTKRNDNPAEAGVIEQAIMNTNAKGKPNLVTDILRALDKENKEAVKKGTAAKNAERFKFYCDISKRMYVPGNFAYAVGRVLEVIKRGLDLNDVENIRAMFASWAKGSSARGKVYQFVKGLKVTDLKKEMIRQLAFVLFREAYIRPGDINPEDVGAAVRKAFENTAVLQGDGISADEMLILKVEGSKLFADTLKPKATQRKYAIDALDDMLKTDFEKAKEEAKAAIKKAKDDLAGYKDWEGAEFLTEEVINPIIENLNKILKKADDLVEKAQPDKLDNLKKFPETMTKFIEGAKKKVKKAAEAGKEVTEESIRTAIKKAKDDLAGYKDWEGAEFLLEEVINPIIENLNKILKKADDLVEKAQPDKLDNLKKFPETMTKFIEGAKKKVKKAAEAGKEVTEESIRTAINAAINPSKLDSDNIDACFNAITGKDILGSPWTKASPDNENAVIARLGLVLADWYEKPAFNDIIIKSVTKLDVNVRKALVPLILASLPEDITFKRLLEISQAMYETGLHSDLLPDAVSAVFDLYSMDDASFIDVLVAYWLGITNKQLIKVINDKIKSIPNENKTLLIKRFAYTLFSKNFSLEKPDKNKAVKDAYDPAKNFIFIMTGLTDLEIYELVGSEAKNWAKANYQNGVLPKKITRPLLISLR